MGHSTDDSANHDRALPNESWLNAFRLISPLDIEQQIAPNMRGVTRMYTYIMAAWSATISATPAAYCAALLFKHEQHWYIPTVITAILMGFAGVFLPRLIAIAIIKLAVKFRAEETS